MHTTVAITINASTTNGAAATITKTKDIMVKLSGNVEPNQNTLCACRISKGCTSKIPRMTQTIKFKLSG